MGEITVLFSSIMVYVMWSFSTMESAEAMIVFNKYDELMELVKKYVQCYIIY